MTDPKKMAAMALEVLPPPDRLKKRPPPGMNDEPMDGDEDTEDSGTKAGELAMDDLKSAIDSGDTGAMFKAFQAAMDAIHIDEANQNKAGL